MYSSSALTTLGGYMGYLTGSTGSEETIGVGVIDATGTNYLIATDAGVRMSGETADLYVSGDKIVANGAMTCKDTLTVTGATTLSSTLAVSGAATFGGSVQIAFAKDIYWADRAGAYYSIHEPKDREIVSTRIKDRVFQRSLCQNYFYPTMTKSFIYDNCACQVNKGNDFARNRLKRHIQHYVREHGTNGTVLKMDITNFFGSASHEQAISTVTKRCDDEWAIGEIVRIVNSFNQGENPDVGMGLGSETTQLIQLAVLDDLDHYIKEQLHIKHYVRYNDDMILIHESKAYLKECEVKIQARLEAKGLTLSEKKTQIFPLAQGIKFLGFRFRPTETEKVIMTISSEKVSHERRKLKKLVQRAKAGLMTRTEVDDCYTARKAHASKGNCHNLILAMDKYYKELCASDL